ncbi:glycosyltransferase family 4 protein [Phenylobacterium sp.]|uniref:glycosyltransferase family 4 protein n=1 Tax=Phenylobacterium sp. TaxID=1871053 RepID=UPI0035C8446C
MEVHFPRMLERSRIVGSGTLKTPRPGFRPGDALGPILSVGTTNKNKNYPTLIRAYANSGVQNPLVIVGRRGDDFDAISSLLDSYKNLDVRILHGLTDVELDALYQDAALCVFVSHYEGYGIPVSEAIALGAPVICSNIPTFLDIAGNAAMYVDPYNLDGIADAIRSVLLNKEALEVMRYRSLQRAKIISFDAAFRKIIEFATDVVS